MRDKYEGSLEFGPNSESQKHVRVFLFALKENKSLKCGSETGHPIGLFYETNNIYIICYETNNIYIMRQLQY